MGNRCDKLQDFENVCNIGQCIQAVETLNTNNYFESYWVLYNNPTPSPDGVIEISVSSASVAHPIISTIENRLLVHFNHVQPLTDNDVCPFFANLYGLAFHCDLAHVTDIVSHSQSPDPQPYFIRNIETIVENMQNDHPPSTNRIPIEEGDVPPAVQDPEYLYNIALKQNFGNMLTFEDMYIPFLSSPETFWRVMFQLAVALYALECSHVFIDNFDAQQLHFIYDAPFYWNYLINDTIYHMFTDYKIVVDIIGHVTVDTPYPQNRMWLSAVRSIYYSSRYFYHDQLLNVVTSNAALQQEMMNDYFLPSRFGSLIDPLPVVITKLAVLAGHFTMLPQELALSKDNDSVLFALRPQDFDANGKLIQVDAPVVVNMLHALQQPHPKPAAGKQLRKSIKTLKVRLEELETQLIDESDEYHQLLREVNYKILQ
jgi:hypothetical protein